MNRSSSLRRISKNSVQNINRNGEGNELPSTLTSFKFPFKVTHIGNTVHTFGASNKDVRDDWIKCLLNAKKSYYSYTINNNTEPFKLKIISDCNFYYDPITPFKNTFTSTSGYNYQLFELTDRDDDSDNSVSRTISTLVAEKKDRENIDQCKRLNSTEIKCSVSFSDPVTDTSYTLLGFENGIFMGKTNDSKTWRKICDLKNIIKMDIITTSNFNRHKQYDTGPNGINDHKYSIVILYEKSLIGFVLDVAIYYFEKCNIIPLIHLTKLAKEDVQLFESTGMRNARSEIIYLKKKIFSLSSSSQFRNIILGIDSMELYRKKFSKKEFTLECDCHGLTIFDNGIVLHTNHGFKRIDRKTQGVSPAPYTEKQILDKYDYEFQTANLNQMVEQLTFSATSLNQPKPLSIYRISEIEYILCYNEFALFCNQFMLITRPNNFIYYLSKANTVKYLCGYLIIASDEIVEIRKIVRSSNNIDNNNDNGNLKQIITGSNIKLLECTGTDTDNGFEGQINFKISMCHPKYYYIQLVIQLTLDQNYNSNVPNLLLVG